MNPTLARPVLAVSFAVNSVIGVAFLISYWIATDPTTAFIRAAFFVLIMAAVHLIGLRIYCSQNPAIEKAGYGFDSRSVNLAKLKPHLKSVALTQLPCLILTSLVLDGGELFRICVATAVLHWVLIAIVCANEKEKCSSAESMLIRWGFFPCILLTSLLTL